MSDAEVCASQLNFTDFIFLPFDLASHQQYLPNIFLKLLFRMEYVLVFPCVEDWFI